jgi:glycosyltransferase involved in cell wall biosynthesis
MGVDLSVIIPARNEEFLERTISDVLRKARANTEVIAILDGYWPVAPGLKVRENLTVIHNEESIGQRASVNQGANFSNAEYVMKLDAHCCLDNGFDVKLIETYEPDWIVIPTMYTLHAFDWVCRDCGYSEYQGRKPEKCPKCGSPNLERKFFWRRNLQKKTEYMWIDKDLRMRYFDGTCLRSYGDPHKIKKMCHHKYRDWAAENITDTMTCVGCCFFMSRKRFFELDGMDDKGHGSWGQMGTEVAMKAWLSGGRLVVNKNTWFAHLFRTQGGDFGFPYTISGKAQRAARKYSNDLWKNNRWKKQVRPFEWVIEKFRPLPGWHQDFLDKEIKKKQAPKNTLPTKFKSISKSKGIVYYTNNVIEDRIAIVARAQLKKCCEGMEIVSVSHVPLEMGENIVVNMESSILSMFKQILLGLECSKSEIIFLTEHDLLYHPSHFQFAPESKDAYYYNENNWCLDSKTGQALFYRPRQQVSGLCAYRDTLLAHYSARVERVEKEGFSRKMGFEPGKKLPHGIDNVPRKGFFSMFPNVDIKHGSNITKGRFNLDQYRCKEKIKDSWVLADGIPYWGKTRGRFDEFIRTVLTKKV